MNDTTLVTGGTGFVGRELIKRLDNVTITTRSKSIANLDLDSPVDVIQWDPAKEALNLSGTPRFRTVINLMGESIADGRWSQEKKKRLRDSRVIGTRKLLDALIESKQLPEVLVSASAIGIYGDAGDSFVEEDHQHGSGFLTEICEEWESESLRLAQHGVRVVCLRIGIVLGAGGALKKMTPLFRWGLGGSLGNGKQYMAWIHIDDLVSMILWASRNESVSGAVNATAPNPISNRDFTRELAKTVGRPAILPVPKFVLKLMLGEFAESLFYSQRVIPAKALGNGFQFKFSEARNAIRDVID